MGLHVTFGNIDNISIKANESTQLYVDYDAYINPMFQKKFDKGNETTPLSSGYMTAVLMESRIKERLTIGSAMETAYDSGYKLQEKIKLLESGKVDYGTMTTELNKKFNNGSGVLMYSDAVALGNQVKANTYNILTKFNTGGPTGVQFDTAEKMKNEILLRTLSGGYAGTSQDLYDTLTTLDTDIRADKLDIQSGLNPWVSAVEKSGSAILKYVDEVSVGFLERNGDETINGSLAIVGEGAYLTCSGYGTYGDTVSTPEVMVTTSSLEYVGETTAAGLQIDGYGRIFFEMYPATELIV